MFKIVSTAALAIAFTTSALAQKPAQPAATPAPTAKAKAELCTLAGEHIETALKEVAHSNYSSLGDNSAPRETNRQLRASVALQTIGLQLQHMQAAGCPTYPRTLDPDAYRVAALDCHMSSGGPDGQRKCLRPNWKRDSDMPQEKKD